MKRYRTSQFKGGWLYGDFSPSMYRSKDTEVGILSFPKNHQSTNHVHKEATEINVVMSGAMLVNHEIMTEGDIFVIEPGEPAKALFIKDTTLLCIKYPSCPGDKYEV